MTPRPAILPLLCLVALGLVSCSKEQPVPITRSRPLSEAERRPLLGATSQERFALAMPGPPMGDSTAGSSDESGTPHFVWDTPPGWTVTPHPMRDVSLSFGNGGECSVIRAGGNLTDNVNRWRKQMGLPEISAEEAQALPTRPLLGQTAYTTTLDGNYKAVGAESASANYRMIGVILPFQEQNASLFVKMVGPRDVVEQNEAAFQAFCDSLRLVTS
jgi:hypothetical protein